MGYEENPYDADTPQLLADLYNRTGDYLLGLEMIEHAVKFQPRNRELLTRRAELLEVARRMGEGARRPPASC